MKQRPIFTARFVRVPRLLMALICLAFLMPALPALSITLVNNGTSDYVIAKQTGCDSTTSQAATDLRNYLEAISGATLTINSYADLGSVPSKAIVIGNLVTSPTLALEQVEMKVSGDRLILRGGSSLAHRYAVFAFLEEELGCRYYSPTVEYVPDQSTITVDNAYDGTHTPSFAMRYLYQKDATITASATWRVKNRINGQVDIEGNPHNVFTVVPPATYYSSNPEFYPLNNGQRVYNNSKAWLCWTNQDVPQVIANWVKGRMAATGANTIVNVGQGDDYANYCECQACQTAYAEEGNAWSGVMLRGMNAAADIVAQTYPNRKMMTFAYMHTEKPPSTTAPRANLIIRLCHWRRCDLHGLEACSDHDIFKTRLTGWKGKTDPEQLYIWHYTTSFDSPCAPWPNVYSLIPDIKYYWNNDVRGLYYQGVYWAEGGDLSWLKLYLQAKAMWNKDVDAEEVYEDFLTGYYGAAAEKMAEYIDYLEQRTLDLNWHPDGITSSLDGIKSKLLPDAVLEDLEALYDAAEAAALNVSQALFERVRYDRASLLFMRIYDKKWLSRLSTPADRVVKLGDNRYYDWKTTFFDIIGPRGVGSEFSSANRSRLSLMPLQAGDVVSIENDAVKISVCPWLQGAIVGLVDKRTGQELMHHARKYYDLSNKYDTTPFNGFFWNANTYSDGSLYRREAATDCTTDTLPDGTKTLTVVYDFGVGAWSPSTPTRRVTKVITLPPGTATNFTLSEKLKNLTGDTVGDSRKTIGRLYLGGDTFFGDILVTEPNDATALITTFPTTIDAKAVAFDNVEFGVRMLLEFDEALPTTSVTVKGVNSEDSFNSLVTFFNSGTHGLSPYEEKEVMNFTCTLSEISASPSPGEDMIWTDFRNTFADPQFGGVLYKTAGGAAYNADAVSSKMLYGDGFVEWQFATPGQNQVLGLNPSNPSADRNIRYAIRSYTSGGTAYARVWETNTEKGDTLVVQPNDIFRIERVGATVSYKRNGSTFYTSTVPSTDPLLVDTCLYTTGARNGVYHCRIEAENVAPTVTLTAPTSGAVVVGNSVTLTANAADADGEIARVEFYAGETKLGEVSTSPYSFQWDTVTGGGHNLTAKAIDNDDAVTTSAAVGIVVWNNADVGNVGVSGSASYSSGEFTVNGAGAAGIKSGTTADAFHYVYQPISGDCTIVARITSMENTTSNRGGIMIRETLDNGSKHIAMTYRRDTPRFYSVYRTTTDGSSGQVYVAAASLPQWVKIVRADNNFKTYYSANGSDWTQQTSQNITMSSSVYLGIATSSNYSNVTRWLKADNVSILKSTDAPEVSITSPANGTNLQTPATITITADAEDGDGVITKVEFYEGTTKLGEDTSSPYSYVWEDVTSGSYSLTARAYDNYGASTVSEAVSVIVQELPTVSLTAPSDGTVVLGNTLTFTADAADSDGAIVKVEFYAGETKVGEDSTSPYSFQWDTVTGGTHALTAKAIDDLGGETVSAAVNVTVWNNADIGNVGTAGSASYSSGEFTVHGAGVNNIKSGTTTDAFHYVYQPVTDDCTIIARIPWMENTTSNRGGVMIRESLDANSKHMSMTYRRDTPRFYAVWRSSTGGSSSQSYVTAPSLPQWVKVVRSGNSFKAYSSPDGIEWTQQASQSIVMSSTVYVGMGVSSNYSSVTRQMKCDNVTVLQGANLAPSVSLTDPEDEAVVCGGGFTITAVAEDEDGWITKVEFYEGANKLGQATSSPYSYYWDAPTPGQYTLTAKAFDIGDASTVSDAITVRVNALPTADLTYPEDEAEFEGPAYITITAEADDTDGTIEKVEFYEGENKLGEAVDSPYSFDWDNVPAGEYSLTVKAIDNDGGSTVSAAVNITVTGNLPPTVSITSPEDEEEFEEAPANITITATASDADGTITKVEFYEGENKLGEDSTSPYSYQWNNVTTGIYTLRARAFDNEGGNAYSAPVVIRVGTNEPPDVTLTAPADGAVIIGDGCTLTATASDTDGTITRVEFYQGETKLGEDTSSPYSYDWEDIPAGVYSITAKAYDNFGDSTVSDAAEITVWNNADVGNVGTAGSASYSSGEFTVNGAGSAGIKSGLTADAFHYVYRTISGDCTIIARITSMENSTSNRGGIMIRETLDGGSKHIAMTYRRDTPRFYSVYRTTTDAESGQVYVAADSLPQWVKIVRADDNFKTYYSANGSDWTQQRSQNITMSSTVYLGIATSSNYSSPTRWLKADNVSVTDD